MTTTAPALSQAGARSAGRGANSIRRFYWLLILPAAVMMAGLYFYPLTKVLVISVTEPGVLCAS